ncbi:MAG TPA: gamma-glutamyltransferase family protein [Candidatus Binataceae bacterium]|nr:gamma-glutamyltransferase family protein [Candidatus Binataceae bacterium]
MSTVYPLVMGREVMLATEHYLSAAAGARIFARGGNAIDAAVAATFVEGVVNPHMHTIGGEAPMLIYSASARRVVAINGNMIAPARATIEHYRSLGLKLVPHSGLLAAGVPAAFDALVTALSEFGTMSLAEVLEPALMLADAGFPMHVGLAGEILDASNSQYAGAGASIRTFAKKFLSEWPSSARVYMPDGEVPKVGTVIKNPALARFFKRLLDAETSAKNRGREAALKAASERFYRGDIAAEIVEWSDANGGLLQASDLAAFETRIETPVSADYRGTTVHKCGPWSQGPVFLQQLKILEGFDLSSMGHNSADYIHTVAETAKLAFADREAYYADPEFVEVPIDALVSKKYADLRRALIDAKRASMDQRPGDPIAMRPLRSGGVEARAWGGGTVHVTACDRAGNMIAVTASGGWIPSSPVMEALGFPLGSRMQTFFLDEKHPNALKPGKRPRTTLSPSLAMRGDQPYLAFGTPGGDQQDQWTLQFFLNVIDFGMTLQQAIEAPKFSSAHFPSTFYPHNARPGVLRIEDRVDEKVRTQLAARGHEIELRPPWSEGHVLAVELDSDRGLLRGGCDPRGQAVPSMPAATIGW